LGRKIRAGVLCRPGCDLPLGCLYWTGGITGLAVICAFAALPGTLPQVAIGMIPGESVDPRDRGTALGLVMGCAELAGGFATPSLVGLLAIVPA